MFRSPYRQMVHALAIAGLTLAACAPQTVVQTVEVTKEVPVVQTQVITETQIVEVPRGAFTTPNPRLSDVRVRQGLFYCTNRAELIKSVYPLLSEAEQTGLIMNTFVSRNHWAYAGDENITLYPHDPAKGGALLDEAGWTLAQGATFRTNAAGEELALKFTTTAATFRQTWAAVWEAQMANCGVRIVRQHVPAGWLFGDTTGLSRRDFEIAGYAFGGEPDPGGQNTYACDQIPLPENVWAGQNYMGWCNETAHAAINLANNTLRKDERVAAYRTFQQEFSKDVPSIVLFNRTEQFAMHAELQGFQPVSGQEFITYNVTDWEISGRDTLVYGFTQEPPTLFTLVESSKVAVLANSLIQSFAFTSLNYDYQPVALQQFGTLENGGATLATVEVKEGDQVMDATGQPVTLAAGMNVKNADGEVVEFTGGTLSMPQLTVKFEHRTDLVWSDGTPVSQADFELKWKIDCDPASGATTFITCNSVQNKEFFANGYTLTYIPGSLSPTYFIPLDGANLPDIYPAHLVIQSDGPYQGQKLADVPAQDWATLPEIAERPIGVGPYQIVEWIKGERMVFEANPHYYGGAPKTPRIVISFIASENAEAQLLGGQIDLLDDISLVGLSESLNRGTQEGLIKNIAIAGGTWEHIDFNLFLP